MRNELIYRSIFYIYLVIQKQMNRSDEETMKKTSVVNLDKLLDDFSEIEKVREEDKKTWDCHV